MESVNGDARLGIEVTRQCNSACLHCFAGASENNQAEIPFGVLMRIIQEGAEAGYRHLHLTGGEPLLYNDLYETLVFALDAGYKTILLNTNGMLLERKIGQSLANHPGLTLSISLEGSEDLHDGLRGNGTHRKALKGLAVGLDAGLNIIIFTIACKSALPDLPRFADNLFTDYPGIKYLTLNRLVTSANNHRVLKKEFLSPKDFVSLIRILSVLNLIDRPTTLLNEPLLNAVSRITALPWVPESRALRCHGNLMVLADLSMDVFHTSRAYCGQYGAMSIKKALSSDQYQRAVSPDTTICPACRYAAICHESGLLRPIDMKTGAMGGPRFCEVVLDSVVDYA